jgi:hypothetical protein
VHQHCRWIEWAALALDDIGVAIRVQVGRHRAGRTRRDEVGGEVPKTVIAELIEARCRRDVHPRGHEGIEIAIAVRIRELHAPTSCAGLAGNDVDCRQVEMLAPLAEHQVQLLGGHLDPQADQIGPAISIDVSQIQGIELELRISVHTDREVPTAIPEMHLGLT